MFVLYNSEDLQDAVLSIIESILTAPKLQNNIYLISPWITNFTFSSDIVHQSHQTRVFFGKYEPLSLFTILMLIKNKVSSLNDPTLEMLPSLLIVLHDFSVKQDGSSIPIELGENNSINEILDAYTVIYNSYYQKTIYNSIWLRNKTIKILTNKDRLQKSVIFDIITELGLNLNQIQKNKDTLHFLKKLIDNNFTVLLHNNFHSKIFYSEFGAIAGSSNWTGGGFMKNDEINVYIPGSFKESGNSLELIRKRCEDIVSKATIIKKKGYETIMNIHETMEKLYQQLLDILL